MRIDPKNLAQVIADTGLISKQDLEVALKHIADNPSLDFGESLVSSGKISDEDLNYAKSHILGIPFVDLAGEKIDFSILSLIPEPIARTHNIVPYKKTDKGLEVAM
ncbi:MAG: hypothetical protein AAB965_01840, partial [Patescibacteria group bacterium]